jgi:penicillin-binding protein 1A
MAKGREILTGWRDAGARAWTRLSDSVRRASTNHGLRRGTRSGMGPDSNGRHGHEDPEPWNGDAAEEGPWRADTDQDGAPWHGDPVGTPPRERTPLDPHADRHENLYAPLPGHELDDDEVTQIWRPDARARQRPARSPAVRRPGPGEVRVAIANRADGGIVYWVAKLYGFTALGLIAVLAITGTALYASAASRTPDIPDLARYAQVVPSVSHLYASDGTLLGEFATEWREVIPYDRIPPKLVEAVLAAEDHDFFLHHGIYFKGIARAAWRNLVAGDFEQGGSTITQQVAKQFLSAEKSLLRKAKEAIFARRLERTYSKKAIFAVYLNHIFLGNGAYGVQAAAHRYFSKKLDELDVGEMATIAGLAQAPSYYSPVVHPDRAQERRNAILERMSRYGFLTAKEAESWQDKPLVLRPYRDVFGDRLPYYAEHVRRYVTKKYGSDALMERGLRVETAVDPVADALAYENIDFGTRKQDKRQGWRGPEAYLDEGRPRELFRARARERYGDGALESGRRYLGLVEVVEANRAKVLVGGNRYELPLSSTRWAAPWSKKDDTNDHTITSLVGALKVGDVVWVKRDEPIAGEFRDWIGETGSSPRWVNAPGQEKLSRLREEATGRVTLEQVPHPQSAIFTADHTTGYVLAMVGGTDHDRSQYNRAIQACRQPGSTYKPIYYSAALNEGYGYETALNDIPRGEIDPVTGEIWVPRNLGGTVDFVVNMEYALVYSKNIPSVALFKKVGAQNVAAWARRLGFTTEIIADKALALGASCTTVHELTRAFAIFARNGKWIDWIYARRIFDRAGNAVEDNTVYFDPLLPSADRLDRLYATAGVAPKQAIPPRAGYLINKLLASVVEHGFSSILRKTNIHAAGKTGTSSATMDTTFVAYTSRWITTVWMGDDLRERPLGHSDAAFIVVEPIWSRFMSEATIGHPNRPVPWSVPRGVDPKDRGDRDKSPQKSMSLVYRERAKPEDILPLEMAPPEG